jgi:hypothetical protein
MSPAYPYPGSGLIALLLLSMLLLLLPRPEICFYGTYFASCIVEISYANTLFSHALKSSLPYR